MGSIVSGIFGGGSSGGGEEVEANKFLQQLHSI
jgi:hypothetical protein